MQFGLLVLGTGVEPARPLRDIGFSCYSMLPQPMQDNTLLQSGLFHNHAFLFRLKVYSLYTFKNNRKFVRMKLHLHYVQRRSQLNSGSCYLSTILLSSSLSYYQEFRRISLLLLQCFHLQHSKCFSLYNYPYMNDSQDTTFVDSQFYYQNDYHLHDVILI